MYPHIHLVHLLIVHLCSGLCVVDRVLFTAQVGEGVPSSVKGVYARHTSDVANFLRVSWG